MEDDTPAQKVIWNVPNILTVARLVLSMFCFVCFAFEWYLPALIFFVIAAGTDWVDGFWARRYGQVTQLGRILDPFADKIVICGTFIFLAAVPPTIRANRPRKSLLGWRCLSSPANCSSPRSADSSKNAAPISRPSSRANGKWCSSALPSPPAWPGCGSPIP